MTIELTGRIDSENAARIEQNIMAQLASSGESAVVLDAAGLEYISSAGLRTILHVRKAYPELRIVNVSSGVYDILEMTGFTTMMPVEKAYRTVSIEGCEEIGRGANGIIYRIDRDTVVKVYQDMNALSEIQHEREVAKLALILGIPTAISYDVVKVGDSYGSVFELLNARSFSKILAAEPEKLDWCVGEYVSLLKKIHSTLVPEGKLPDIRDTALEWAQGITDCLPDAAGKKLLALVKAVPYNDHMIHGDYHTKNVELQGDEVLIIDMDTLSVGHPVFELASMYNAFIGYSEMDRDCVKRFQGYDLETARTFWDKSLKAYLGTDNPGKLREVEDKARIVGYSRMIRRAIRHGGLETDTGSVEGAAARPAGDHGHPGLRSRRAGAGCGGGKPRRGPGLRGRASGGCGLPCQDADADRSGGGGDIRQHRQLRLRPGEGEGHRPGEDGGGSPLRHHHLPGPGDPL